MISFFVEIVADTRQGEVVSPSRIIFVKNVEKNVKRLACLPQAGASRITRSFYGKGS